MIQITFGGGEKGEDRNKGRSRMWMCKVFGAALTVLGLMAAAVIGTALYGSGDGGYDSVVQMGIPGAMLLTLAASSAIFAGLALTRRGR